MPPPPHLISLNLSNRTRYFWIWNPCASQRNDLPALISHTASVWGFSFDNLSFLFFDTISFSFRFQLLVVFLWELMVGRKSQRKYPSLPGSGKLECEQHWRNWGGGGGILFQNLFFSGMRHLNISRIGIKSGKWKWVSFLFPPLLLPTDEMWMFRVHVEIERLERIITPNCRFAHTPRFPPLSTPSRALNSPHYNHWPKEEGGREKRNFAWWKMGERDRVRRFSNKKWAVFPLLKKVIFFFEKYAREIPVDGFNWQVHFFSRKNNGARMRFWCKFPVSRKKNSKKDLFSDFLFMGNMHIFGGDGFICQAFVENFMRQAQAFNAMFKKAFIF